MLLLSFCFCLDAASAAANDDGMISASLFMSFLLCRYMNLQEGSLFNTLLAVLLVQQQFVMGTPMLPCRLPILCSPLPYQLRGSHLPCHYYLLASIQARSEEVQQPFAFLNFAFFWILNRKKGFQYQEFKFWTIPT